MSPSGHEDPGAVAPAASSDTAREQPDEEIYTVVRRPPYGQWLQAVAVASILSWGLWKAYQADVVLPEVIWRYLFSEQILVAVGRTMLLATLGIAIAILLGIVIALMAVSSNRVTTAIANSYIFVFRGTPMLVQLLIWFNAVPVIVERFHLQIPFTGWVLVSAPTVDVITPFMAALLGLTLAETGYMAEVVRSGMLSVGRGQRDAARALGLTELRIKRRIVVPQAMRIVIPATGNQYIMMIKNTSLAMVLGFGELLRTTTNIYAANFRVMELLLVAAFWYLALTAVATLLQHRLEARFPTR